jgi:hypothetical protein
MATKTRSFRLSEDLMEVAFLRARALGYPDGNALVKALLRYDAFCQGEHPLTLTWAKYRPAEQDKIDAKCLELTKRGKGERGCYWKHLLEKLEDGGNSALQAFYEL